MIFTVLCVVTTLLICLKCYIKFTTGKNNSYVCLLGKTAIVTGANTGIGFWTALDFAKRGGRVILACRNLEKAREAQARIIKETRNENVFVKHLDLSSLKSVAKFADEIIKSNEKVHILINNAAGAGHENELTEDNLDMLMQINYFGSFLLTSLLLDTLKASAPSRIVNVSSLAAKYSVLRNAEEITSFPSGNNVLAQSELYSRSKLCNALFTKKLAELLQDTHVTVNALHPGAVNTELFRKVHKFIIPIFKFVLGNFFKNAEEGAQTTIYVAVSNDTDGMTGCFFSDCKRIDWYETVTRQLTDDVWNKTKALLNERGFATYEKL